MSTKSTPDDQDSEENISETHLVQGHLGKNQDDENPLNDTAIQRFSECRGCFSKDKIISILLKKIARQKLLIESLQHQNNVNGDYNSFDKENEELEDSGDGSTGSEEFTTQPEAMLSLSHSVEDTEDDNTGGDEDVVVKVECLVYSEDHQDITDKFDEGVENGQKKYYKRYHCNECDYSAPLSVKLKHHKASVHGGDQYPCEECGYIAFQTRSLRLHKATVHKGVRYPCEECDFVATQSGTLKRHIASKHVGIRYICDKCDYKASRTDTLKKHIQTKHQRH